MSGYQPLTPEKVQETAASYFAARAAKTTPQEEPTFVLVGGQPGAGKSTAGLMVRDEMSQRGGYIHIDADRLRETINTKGAKPTSEQTQQDAGRLVAELRKNAIADKRNVLEEGTFRDPAGVAKFIDARKQEGYKVELVAVATPREESLLGIYQRHEMQHASGTENPRFVPEKYHDETMDGFEKTLAQNEHKFDRVRVINRAGQVFFDSHAHGNQKHASGLQGLHEGRQLSDARLVDIGKAWSAVKEQGVARGAGDDYLRSIDRNAQDIQTIQKERIHSHAMKQLETNILSIRSDERFDNHSDNELAKVAYFRGFHEKANAFKGAPPDYKTFDSVTSNRDSVKQLPNVEDLENYKVGRTTATIVRERDDDLSL
jgi:UDP-N-acetylglucosamine kinase